MSTDQSPLAVPAALGTAGSVSGPRSGAGPAAPPISSTAPVGDKRSVRHEALLDESTWCGWWRDLIVERYRFDRFDAFVPLPAPACPWELRVALGRVVEESMVGISGPAMTTQLVIEALEVAGFGPVRDLEPDARREALVRSGWCNDPWRGDDDLRLGVLGSIADALLHEVPPSRVAVDLRADPSRPTDGSMVVSSMVLAATRTAVFAYARRVEELAHRSRDVARSYQF